MIQDVMHKTNDPALKSFVPVSADSHFPIQNLPYGAFVSEDGTGRPQPGTGGPSGPGGLSSGSGTSNGSGGLSPGMSDDPHLCVAIGDYVLDLCVLDQEEYFRKGGFQNQGVFSRPVLNEFMALGRKAWLEARTSISRLLRYDNPVLRDNPALREKVLIPRDRVRMVIPVDIGDYTDFYSSREHATNVGIMLRGEENALNPNWLHLPVAYHGRASSVVISGTELNRPYGQILPEGDIFPSYMASRRVDFELEVGFYTGPGNSLGHPVSMDRAADHIFGLSLVNDWSARDIQSWEYVPLGPFSAKNFGTSVSPWIVTLDALEPFRTSGPEQSSPLPLPYLRSPGNSAFDIHLEVLLMSERMRTPARISTSNYKHLYWNMFQQLVHHTVSGCNTRPGDLMASGTISGPRTSSYGSLLELTWNGTSS
jgi:fumarylacetoacetase